VLPRRCALTEIARGQLVAIKVPGLSARRQVRLVFRRGEHSHAAAAFLEVIKSAAEGNGDERGLRT
jgi:DNA-binding transcriptional LysR family regulator